MTDYAHTPPSPYAPGPSASPAPDRRMPGIGAAAAVLGFVEAGFGLALVAYVLVALATLGGAGSDIGSAVVVLLGAIILSGLMLLGSLFLVRRSGRRLLVGSTIAEIVLLLSLWVWALMDSSSVYTSYVDYDYGSTTTTSTPLVVALFVVLLVGLALPVVRLSLATQRVVGAWLQGRPPATPVSSPETQQWVAGPRGGAGTVLALLAPVALLLVATIVVLTTA